MQGAVGDHPKLADLGTVIADTWPSRQVKVVGDATVGKVHRVGEGSELAD